MLKPPATRYSPTMPKSMPIILLGDFAPDNDMKWDLDDISKRLDWIEGAMNTMNVPSHLVRRWLQESEERNQLIAWELIAENDIRHVVSIADRCSRLRATVPNN